LSAYIVKRLSQIGSRLLSRGTATVRDLFPGPLFRPNKGGGQCTPD